MVEWRKSINFAAKIKSEYPMSEFDSKRKAIEKAQKRNDIRKEKLAGYFFDLSKLVFGGLVIGGISPMFVGGESHIDILMFVMGLLSTFVFAYTSNRILKY